MEEVQYSPPETVECNGIDLHYDSFGDPTSPPVILIMGLATQLVHWDEGFCRLLAAQGFRVIRFDNRDIGKSSKLGHLGTPSIPAMLANQWFKRALKAPYLLDDMANDTLGLMDALEIEQAHLVGVSMGGMIAQCIALMAPERVLSLTSIMSTTGDRSLPKPHKSVTMQLIRPLPKEEKAFVEQALKFWALLHGDHFEFDQQRMGNTIRLARSRSYYPQGVLRQLCAIISSPDRTDALKTLNIPTLVIHGDADPLVPIGCGEATANAIPDAKFKVFKGMGHTLPDQLWSSMIDEIKNISQVAGAQSPRVTG